MFSSSFIRAVARAATSRTLVYHARSSSRIQCLALAAPSRRRFTTSATQSRQRNCPNCGKPLSSALPACNSCWRIFVLPNDVSHHALLGIPYEPNPFVVDIPTLKRNFRRAQSVCHPDSWASKNPGQQDSAHALSARVNQAYRSLLDPLARAEYILERNNVSVSETDQVQDVAFMSEIMEIREEIEEAEDNEQVEAMLEQTTDKISSTVDEIESLVGTKEWNGVKAAVIKLRYLNGILEAAKRWLDQR
ncbi:Co-chaperone Hsc20 [Coprinopsis marcescibilis]|uniref:Co-chaperone Hsc20 n=1 Tax=Coprinopsis marcescibilis TaxID=230819 RepID=A0A5C3LBK9_COPMA|nr:Co-chaperone Hsc20 [Coprinopsis marcescibilis]